MKHRVGAVFVALLLLLPLAASFATGQNEGTGAPSSDKEVHLVGYLLGSAPGMPDVMTALNAKLKKDLNVSMDINYIGWGDMAAKYPLVLAAGEDIDWIFTANWSYYFQEASKGAFLELSDQALQQNMPLHYKVMSKGAWDQARLPDGKLYMIPTSTPDRKVPLAVIRGDLRKKYGVPPVTEIRRHRAVSQGDQGQRAGHDSDEHGKPV